MGAFAIYMVMLNFHLNRIRCDIALQKMACYEFRSNDIINPTKSQCMVFKPNRFKLYCPAVYLNGNIIDYVEKTKYLGYMFTNACYVYCICDQTK